MDISQIWDDFLKGLQTIGGIYGDVKTGEQKAKFFSELGKVLPLLIIGIVIILVVAFKRS